MTIPLQQLRSWVVGAGCAALVASGLACSAPAASPAPGSKQQAAAAWTGTMGRLQLMARDSATGHRLAATSRFTTASEGARALAIPGEGPMLASPVAADGPLAVAVSAAGYRPLASDVEVHPDRALPVTFWLDPEQAPEELRPEAVEARLRPGFTLLHGHVTDVSAGRPVNGARVLAVHSGLEARTDGRGYFSLLVPARGGGNEALPETEDLEISQPGYKRYQLGRTYLLPGRDTHFLIDLEPGAGTSGRDDAHSTLLEALGQPAQRVTPEPGALREAAVPTGGAAPITTAPITAALAATIPVPTNVRVGTSCSCTSCAAVSVYSRETYVSYGLNDEWIASWNINSLKAGAVAYRSYGSYYALVGRLSSSYDICNNTCCQVLDTDTSTSSDYVNAISGTSGIVLSGDSRSAARSEYAAETNHQGTCLNGYTGDGSGWPCLSDSVCAGTAPSGHGRGMCQWGSQRWAANQLQTYTWILDHYYNNNGAPSGSRNVYRKTGSTACLGAANDTNCDNFDPIGDGCSYDATTPTGAKVAITNGAGTTMGWVELRWSSSCGSNWARVTSNIGGTSMTGTVRRDDGVSFTDTWSGTTTWSPLVYSPVRAAQACGTIAGYSNCTAWY